MRRRLEPDQPLQINVVPLIDVLFALLTFFVLSTLVLTRSEGLPVNLPKAATAKSQTQTRVTVTINPQGALALNRKPIQLDALEGRVRELMATNQQTVVVINADEGVDHGQVIAVMDRVRRIEGAKLAIATQRP